jgi:hypothetical protein
MMISRVACRVQLVFRRLAPIAIALLAALLPAAQAQADSYYLAYVTMQNGVAVIDTDTETLLGTAQVCSAGTPAAAGVAVLGSRLYVTCLNEGVVKVVDRKKVTNGSNFTLVATIQLPPGSLHSKSSAVITQDGSQLYITTKQGVAIVDTATNTIVNNLPLGPVSALDVGPNQTYVQLQNGQVVPLGQAQAAQVTDPNAVFGGPDQPIVHDSNASAWISGSNLIGDTNFDALFPTDDPYFTPIRVGPAGPLNQLPIQGDLTAFAFGDLGNGIKPMYVAYRADVTLALPAGWQWRYNIGLSIVN